MKKQLKKITQSVYAFLLWDESWNSYNNCYILIEGDNVTLIDSGKEEHFEHLEFAINSLGINNRDITNFVATHGHKDHVGGIRFLQDVRGFIHTCDVELLPENMKSKFNCELPNNGLTVNNLECTLLGHHTKGSVALYHCDSKALFCGDHICFFGERLNGNNVVDEGKKDREKLKNFISELAQSEEMRIQHQFDLFIKGLRAINKFDIDYLCTGHGVILKDNINEFIADVLDLE